MTLLTASTSLVSFSNSLSSCRGSHLVIDLAMQIFNLTLTLTVLLGLLIRVCGRVGGVFSAFTQ
jgi:hypothetical protein